MSHISGQVKGLLSKITSVDQGNYPEMMGKTFIINAPGMFKLVWGIVKRFLDARTLTKIEVGSPASPNPLDSGAGLFAAGFRVPMHLEPSSIVFTILFG